MSAHYDSETGKIQANAFIKKPFDIDYLVSTVRNNLITNDSAYEKNNQHLGAHEHIATE